MDHFTLKKFNMLLVMLSISITQLSFGQAKKYVLMEEFTNTDCGPCAQANPGFESDILEPNKGNVHEIGYHPWWPGNTDPMYLYDVSEITTRTNYYGITGVPTVVFLGNEQVSPTAITQAMVNTAEADGSPIRILVSQTSNGQSRDVRVVVHTVGTAPSGNLKLYAAVVESDITYTTAPGSNGEKYFPNVFRKMLSSMSGDSYTAASTGDSVVYTFSYTLDIANWDTSKIYVTAWVQDYSTQEILNSGASNDPTYEFVTASSAIQAPDTTTNMASFNFNALNFANTTDSFRIYVSFTQPASWDAGVKIDGNWTNWNTSSVTDSFDITVAANTIDSSFLSITTSDAGVGKYYIRFKSLTNTTFAEQELDFVVINDVTDLVINNTGSWGDGNTYDFENIYTDGLNTAGCTAYGSINSDWLAKANKVNALTGVKNIYYNDAWTFPAFTDEVALELENFMDNGGNLFVSGQDIGWDNSGDTYSNGTPTTEAFYSNYLNAQFISDGSSSSKTLEAISSDAIFGTAGKSNITGVYGSKYIYPDEISPSFNGAAIAYYNGSSSTIGGIRAEYGYKVVYLGVGIEMLDDVNTKNQILDLSYQWFNGSLSTIEFDKQMLALSLGNNYPNPANDYTTIPVNGDLTQNCNLEIRDLSGRLIDTQIVEAHATSIIIDTKNLSEGMYMYSLKDNQHTYSGKVDVLR